MLQVMRASHRVMAVVMERSKVPGSINKSKSICVVFSELISSQNMTEKFNNQVLCGYL